MQVQPPTLEDAKGYDLIVWLNEDGEVLTKSYSLMGEVILRGMTPNYEPGDVLEILVHPDEFNRDIPPSARVGYVDPHTNRLRRIDKGLFH